MRNGASLDDTSCCKNGGSLLHFAIEHSSSVEDPDKALCLKELLKTSLLTKIDDNDDSGLTLFLLHFFIQRNHIVLQSYRVSYTE